MNSRLFVKESDINFTRASMATFRDSGGINNILSPQRYLQGARYSHVAKD